MDVQAGLQLKDLVAMLRRRLGVILAVAGAVFLAAVLVAAFLPNQYESYATLLVEPQAISQKLVEAGLEGSDLNSRLHLMTMQILSRPRLSRVIDELGLYAAESKERTREEVIGLMRGRIRVEPVLPELEQGTLRRSRDVAINTFRLHFRDDSSRTAAEVTNRLANDFIEEHIRERVQISGDTAEFIDSERTRLAQRIRELEAQIAQVKGENAGRLPEDMVANQRILERALGDLRAVERELAQARSDEAFYGQQVLNSASGAGPEDVVSPARRMRLLELQLAEQRSRGFTDKHPDVIAVRQEIAVLRQQVGEPGDGEEPSSLVQQNAQAEQNRAALRAQAALAEMERLRVQIDEAQAKLAATPRVAEQLDGLQREYEHLFRSYQQFSSKRLDAAVAANMERRQKGEQVRVLEAAFPAPVPSSPNRPLILVLGAMLGLALGGGVGLLLESVDSSFHDARRLQQALRVPVLAAIPGILLESDRRALRRRRLARGVGAAVVVLVVLGAAAVGYRVVNGGGKAGGSRPAPAAAAFDGFERLG